MNTRYPLTSNTKILRYEPLGSIDENDMNPTDTIGVLEQTLYDLFSKNFVLVRVLPSILVIVLLLVLRQVLRRLLERQNLPPEEQYRWWKIIAYVIYALGLLLLGAIWIRGVSQVATILAILLAGAAIALNQPLSNLGGWAYIMWRRPFVLGDRVEVNGVRGEVADISPFVFTLAEVGAELGADQLTGEVVHVPNSWVFSYMIGNSTQGFDTVWDEIPVVVTFESDWQKAKAILTEIGDSRTGEMAAVAEEKVRRATTRFIIPAKAFTPRVFTSVVDIGVELTMRYVVAVRNRRATRESLWENILLAFEAEDDIDFAYPTQRFYTNPVEGKPGTGGPKTGKAKLPPEAQ